MSKPVARVKDDGAVLFDIAARRREHAGPVESAARTTLDAAVRDDRLDATADALLIAHTIALAARVDDTAERFDPYGAAQVSRELRETFRDLGLSVGARSTAAHPLAGLFDDDDDDGA